LNAILLTMITVANTTTYVGLKWFFWYNIKEDNIM
jgi:nitrogen fixation-related uncharacterized protein